MAEAGNRNSSASFGTDISAVSNEDYCNSGLIVSSASRSLVPSPSHFLSLNRQQGLLDGESAGAAAATAYTSQQQKNSRQSECPYVGEGELNGRRLRDESVDESVEDLVNTEEESQSHFLTSWMKRYPAPSNSTTPLPPQSNPSTLGKAPLEEKPSTSSHKYATLSVETLEPDSLYTSRSEAEGSADQEPFKRNERNRATLARILAIDPSKQSTGDAPISTQPQQCSIKGVQKFPQVLQQNSVAPYNHHIPQLVAGQAQRNSPKAEQVPVGSPPTMHHPADRNTPPATTTAAAAAATRTTGTAGAGAGAMHKLSNDYDDLTYRTGQPPLSASSQRPRMHIDDSIHPYHVTANHRVPQSDSDAQVSAALYPLTSPTNSTSTGRHFQTAGPFYRPASPTTSTCVSCFGVRTKPYNAKLVATSNRNPRNGGSSRSRGKNASSPSPVDGTQCKAYHRLTLVMSLIAAVLSLAALAITLLVFLGILKTDMTGSCECNAQNGILGQPANTATTTAMPASKFPVSTPTPITNAPLANTSEQCTPVCNASLASLVRGERGPRGQQGPIGPAGPQGAQGIPWVCPVTGWIQFGQTCIGEAEPGSIFTYEAGRSKCAEIANAPGAKPLVITSRWLALMAFTLAVREESIWTSLQTGEDGLLKGAGGQSVNALTNSALYKNNNLSGAGCDYISEFTGPTLHPVVRRGSCDTKRPALCIVQP